MHQLAPEWVINKHSVLKETSNYQLLIRNMTQRYKSQRLQANLQDTCVTPIMLYTKANRTLSLIQWWRSLVELCWQPCNHQCTKANCHIYISWRHVINVKDSFCASNLDKIIKLAVLNWWFLFTLFYFFMPTSTKRQAWKLKVKQNNDHGVLISVKCAKED